MSGQLYELINIQFLKNNLSFSDLVFNRMEENLAINSHLKACRHVEFVLQEDFH